MESLSLYELSEQVKQTIKSVFTSSVWIRAEISEIRENASGHCYLELIEKDAENDRIIARVKANIWSFTYKMLKPYFEQSTGQMLSAGMKILVFVNVEYHELYGISLIIKDIDPTFTIGDIAARRMQIIRRLQQEGVFDMNKELEIPLVPQRIAVISSPTAAGYGDFIDQLNNNKNNYHFYHKLFPAVMQGSQTEESVITALDNIYQHIDCFDIVVIIRGGGATADLTSFDSYRLAYYCTQFPLPIVVGIGHQRDETILDLVAHTSLKTPTAVAERLIDTISEVDSFLNETQSDVMKYAKFIVGEEKYHIDAISKEIFRQQKTIKLQETGKLQLLSLQLNNTFQKSISNQYNELQKITSTIDQQVNNYISKKRQILQLFEKNIVLISPDYILQKGYSITLKNGKAVSDSRELKNGDVIKTYFSVGSATSKVIENETSIYINVNHR